MARLNISSINPNFIAGLNKTMYLVGTLARLEQASDEARDNYINEHGKPTTDDEKRDYNDYMKSYRNAVKMYRDKAEYTASAVINRYMDIDFASDDFAFRPSDFESILRNVGALEGSLKDCKAKQFETAKSVYTACIGYLNAVTDRRTSDITKRKKGDDVLTRKASKVLKNTYIEYVLAIVAGLETSDVFEVTRVQDNHKDYGYRVITNRFA